MDDGTPVQVAHRGSLPALLVSACLLGTRCTHDAGHNERPVLDALRDRYRLIPVCPEVAGGLPTPRPAAEIQADGTVRTAAGADVTVHYQRGAAHAVRLARASGAKYAVLKARSPSCGSGRVYDGTFSKTLRPGSGVAAQALEEAGVEVVSDEDAERLLHEGDLPAGEGFSPPAGR